MCAVGSSIRPVTGNVSAHRPAELLPQRARWAPVAVFAALVVIGCVPLNPNLPAALAAAAVSIAASTQLLAPRRSLFLLYAAIAGGGIVVLGLGSTTNIGWFANCVLAGWCVLVGTRSDALLFWLGTQIVFAAQWIWIETDAGWAPWMAGTTLTVLAAMLVRHELDLVGRLREAQAGLADRARVEERNRIARELHDVIAHSLTVSLLHVTSARLAVDHEPAEASRALAEAERLGRESLAEVRATVGMLHQDGGDGHAPLPGVDDLESLVETFRAARADVSLSVDGNTAGIPATTGLAIYRIVQESLTNAVKHAPGTEVAVRLIVAAGVDLSIASAGPPRHGEGMGVVSMRERAEAVGGRCVAGPSGHGWLVHATIPLEANRRQEAAT